MHSFPRYQRLPQSGAFVAIDEPALTHYHRPESPVHISVHSWRCTFYEVGQTGIHHTCIIQNGFTVLKNLCVWPTLFLLTSSSPQYLATFGLFAVSIIWMSYSWNQPVCDLFRLLSHSTVQLFFHSFSWIDSSYLFSVELYSVICTAVYLSIFLPKVSWLLTHSSNYE
jgi:hypothetical protein